jgi:uncharacterized protein
LESDSPDCEFSYTPEEIECACRAELHPEALRGLRLFNAGDYFEAHEALENAWRDEAGPIRDLYRGILQIGVGYYHIQRGNYRGAVKMFQRCRQWLDPFPSNCQGIDIESLRANFLAVEELVHRVGPDGIAHIDNRFFKPISFSDIAPQDEA